MSGLKICWSLLLTKFLPIVSQSLSIINKKLSELFIGDIGLEHVLANELLSLSESLPIIIFLILLEFVYA